MSPDLFDKALASFENGVSEEIEEETEEIEEALEKVKNKKNEDIIKKVDSPSMKLSISKRKKKVGTSAKPTSATNTQKKPKGKSPSSSAKIIGLFGMQGTGKTKRAMDFGRLGKVLYLDLENKAYIIYEEHYQDKGYDIKIENLRRTDRLGHLDSYAMIQDLIEVSPKIINKIEKRIYRTIVLDNLSLLLDGAKEKYFRETAKPKPHPFFWGDVQLILQDILFPFINKCRENNVILILNYGIKDKYLNETLIGTEEDAKQWLLGELDVEMWLERDYQVYCLKHPYKPYWSYRDEDMDFSEYILDKEFINKNVEFKEYQEFKEETLISDTKKLERKVRRKKLSDKLK